MSSGDDRWGILEGYPGLYAIFLCSLNGAKIYCQIAIDSQGRINLSHVQNSLFHRDHSSIKQYRRPTAHWTADRSARSERAHARRSFCTEARRTSEDRQSARQPFTWPSDRTEDWGRLQALSPSVPGRVAQPEWTRKEILQLRLILGPDSSVFSCVPPDREAPPLPSADAAVCAATIEVQGHASFVDLQQR